MYRLALFDLDGTLLNGAREISPANARTLQDLMARGIRVGLATGRTLRSVGPFVERLGLNGPLILFNGARVWDPRERRYLHEVNLPLAEARHALEISRAYGDMHVNLYVGDSIYIARKSPRSLESEIKDGVPHTVVGDLAEWLAGQSGQPAKIMLISEPEQLEDFRSRYRDSGFRSTLVRSEWNYLEIMREGVCKGSALDAIEAACGIPRSEIVAFGDNLNDLELIRGAGLGVAMENAHPELKASARRVIGHHETDAISELLREVYGL